ncbi:hypothetical protein [Methylobacterium sp. 37f]|uniref:hypothetical protein n=1 Tax=Methylobacterium sp. 37f TaxID=2817058 RepID=UPI001FFC9B1C|nr:hypothetical protein [Methylobacterium sp. 37f]MCK2052692.1 hypothetical protein [Methylobacterium sp. 37f]
MTFAQSVNAQCPDESWSSLTGLSDDRLLATIGHSLRNIYEPITDADQPRDLLQLALVIEERVRDLGF